MQGDIENGMVVGAEAEWERICESGGHWDNDRTEELIDEFGQSHWEMIVAVIRDYLEIGEHGDEVLLWNFFWMMPRYQRNEILVKYIDHRKELKDLFDEWWEDRYK